MVLPKFFLDNVKDHARTIIAANGINMLAAYRLPDNLFANVKCRVLQTILALIDAAISILALCEYNICLITLLICFICTSCLVLWVGFVRFVKLIAVFKIVRGEGLTI